MAKHQWSVLCRRGITDRDDNSISLIEALGEVTLIRAFSQDELNQEAIKSAQAAGPGPSVGFQLVTLWMRTDRANPETGLARIRVKSPRGKFIHVQEYEIALEAATRVRHTTRFATFPYDGPGEYSYITQLQRGTEKKPRWATVSDICLDIKEQSEEVPAR